MLAMLICARIACTVGGPYIVAAEDVQNEKIPTTDILYMLY